MQSSTIDHREVAYYERLATEWWNEAGKFWPLHRLNALRVEYLKARICEHFDRTADAAKPLAGLSVVDIGCGGGILAEAMAGLGAEVHGIDVVEKNIEVARRHSRKSGLAIEYEQVTAEALAARGNRYDVLLNMEVVEHVADLPLFMSACGKLVGDTGVAFVATINRNFKSWLFAIVGAEYILRWLPRGTHSWRRFVRPDELRSLLQRDGLEIVDSTGVAVNPLTRKFRLGSSLAVNYMLCASRRDA
ncbi:MAG: bifunctional 2-polyprenyl-6-hydroxyphenol methylase/3-demethylubiquinol 3-O-methyltransferase UbiG [Gammaproteobacteria bacterium]|jgi:2-polyprenyl-6-hydroxyphenyl methylase/3-demethylubiquinone-9 3-methyltransferase